MGFQNASSFNQDLGAWSTNSAESMTDVFLAAGVDICNQRKIEDSWSGSAGDVWPYNWTASQCSPPPSPPPSTPPSEPPSPPSSPPPSYLVLDGYQGYFEDSYC